MLTLKSLTLFHRVDLFMLVRGRILFNNMTEGVCLILCIFYPYAFILICYQANEDTQYVFKKENEYTVSL